MTKRLLNCRFVFCVRHYKGVSHAKDGNVQICAQDPENNKKNKMHIEAVWNSSLQKIDRDREKPKKGGLPLVQCLKNRKTFFVFPQDMISSG